MLDTLFKLPFRSHDSNPFNRSPVGAMLTKDLGFSNASFTTKDLTTFCECIYADLLAEHGDVRLPANHHGGSSEVRPLLEQLAILR